MSVFEVPSFRKSSRSLPAVNTPEPPVMMMQRISGLFCAVSIASLMPRYMSWVIAFFFSGRRSRDHPHRVFVGDYQMLGHAMLSLEQAAKVPLASLQRDILHDP